MPFPIRRAVLVTTTTAALVAGSVLTGSFSASAHPAHDPGRHDGQLTPRTSFTMAADGSSGATQGGEGIPNIDSVKKTIATYYGDPGTGIADKIDSPYIREMRSIMAKQTKELRGEYRRAVAHHQKPAIVLDADDTTLWTYDMEVGDMHFVFTPAEQDVWVQDQRFPAVPAMVSYVNAAKAMGFTIFGLTGRNDDQKAATLANLEKVGYRGFTSDHYFTKWTGKGASQQPSYVQCAAAACTTVEYKALTRKHIERDLGYTIVDNLGDQWSDLQGGYAQEQVKLPNPTYYLPSADLPGVREPWLSPRTHFRMAADGSSGATQGGEGIPNIDSVKKTIATYYGDPGTGIADKTDSPYIREMRSIVRKQAPLVAAQCFVASKQHRNPAIVLDADDTTLWTYDMEVADMHFVFDPALQDEWVQDERFPATPSMTSLVSVAERSGCTIIGLTGRNEAQQTATIEYKSQTRAHIESRSGGHYDIVANFGDQYSDLIGGSADRSVKLPNPTYYLP